MRGAGSGGCRRSTSATIATPCVADSLNLSSHQGAPWRGPPSGFPHWDRSCLECLGLPGVFHALGMEEPEPEVRYQPPRVRVKPPRRPANKPMPEVVDFAADIGGRVEDGGPGKNVLIRNKYVREDTGTHETLKIVDDTLLESDDENGADPYNTGRFDRSKSWDSFRNRK